MKPKIICACECFSLHDWLHMAYDRIDTHDNLKFFIILTHIASKRIKRDATEIYPRARLIYRRIDHKNSLPELHPVDCSGYILKVLLL